MQDMLQAASALRFGFCVFLKDSFENDQNRKGGVNFTIWIWCVSLKDSFEKDQNRKVGYSKEEVYTQFPFRNSNFTILSVFLRKLQENTPNANRKVDAASGFGSRPRIVPA